MTERLKFRIWDKLNKSFLVRRYIKLGKDSEGKPSKIVIYSDKEFYSENTLEHLIECTQGFEVMQCTGVKDKNGKLIYEGDLFKVVEDDVKYLLTCKWDNEKCGFEIYECGSNDPAFFVLTDFEGGFESSKNFSKLEIIGNIYENKGLSTNKGKLK